MLVEALGGILTGSLALISDAGHMLSDVGALALAMVASWYASRPPTLQRTYGFYRAEILAAFVNGLTLVGVSAFVVYEAWQRLWHPPEVKTLPMLAVAATGLGINLFGMAVLYGGMARNLSVRAALLHVLGDAVSSLAVIAGAILMHLTGIYLLDPILSALISVGIVISAWQLLKHAGDILMESVPPGIDLREVRDTILSVPNVLSVHDLHIWTLATGFVAFSGHVVVDPSVGMEVCQDRLVQIREILRDRFGIEHSTVQLEAPYLPDEAIHCVGDPRCLP
jgi:cobalt-zinc-cadmium efflux system protein